MCDRGVSMRGGSETVIFGIFVFGDWLHEAFAFKKKTQRSV